MSEPRRRAGDQERAQRTVTGWVGIVMAVAGFAVGIWWRNPVVLGVSFVAAMWAGNRLPFAHVVKLLPWGRE